MLTLAVVEAREYGAVSRCNSGPRRTPKVGQGPHTQWDREARGLLPHIHGSPPTKSDALAHEDGGSDGEGLFQSRRSLMRLDAN